MRLLPLAPPSGQSSHVTDLYAACEFEPLGKAWVRFVRWRSEQFVSTDLWRQRCVGSTERCYRARSSPGRQEETGGGWERETSAAERRSEESSETHVLVEPESRRVRFQTDVLQRDLLDQVVSLWGETTDVTEVKQIHAHAARLQRHVSLCNTFQHKATPSASQWRCKSCVS